MLKSLKVHETSFWKQQNKFYYTKHLDTSKKSNRYNFLCTCLYTLLQYLSQCDGIIVLSNGRITERGKHDELMAGNGEYSNLITTYYTQDDNEDVDDDIRGNIVLLFLTVCVQSNDVLICYIWQVWCSIIVYIPFLN